MSYAYSQFGTGFEVTQPTGIALRFAAYAQRRGGEVSLTNRLIRSYSGGEPQYSDTTWSIRAFMEEKAARSDSTGGEIRRGSATFYAAAWLPIKPSDLLTANGSTYQVETVVAGKACLQVEASRRLDS
jgi:hypothetical protein